MNQLRKTREATGRSVAGLARITGLSRQAVYALEEGRSEGNLETWIRLANALDVSVEELSGRSFDGLEEYAGKA